MGVPAKGKGKGKGNGKGKDNSNMVATTSARAQKGQCSQTIPVEVMQCNTTPTSTLRTTAGAGGFTLVLHKFYTSFTLVSDYFPKCNQQGISP